MNDCRRALLPFALLLLAGCQARTTSEPPLAGARLGGPFTLTDQDGRRVADTAFAGRYRLVYFGYTFCPDACPTALQHIAAGLRRFERAAPVRAAKLQPIFVTVDPQRDTPAVLKSYVSAFHPRLIGLTGSPAEIKAVAKEYGVAFSRAGDPGASAYLVSHMGPALLFGPDGMPIAMVPEDKDAAAIAAVLDQWVR